MVLPPAGSGSSWLFCFSLFRKEKILDYCLQFFHQHSAAWLRLAELFHQLNAFVFPEGIDFPTGPKSLCVEVSGVIVLVTVWFVSVVLADVTGNGSDCAL